jgi:hypothetical protein
VAIDEIVDVVAMRDCLMPTSRSVDVVLLVRPTVVSWRAIVWISFAYFNLMVVYVISLRVVQVAIVKVVGMTVVFDRRVTTVRVMLVAVSTHMLPVSLGHAFVTS